MNVSRLIEVMEELAPKRFAEDWDNTGLIFGDPQSALSRVLVCVDLTSAVLNEAVQKSCEVVVAYHPPLFRATKQFVSGDLGYEAVKNGISVYSPHTSLDVVEGGTNDHLAKLLKLVDVKPLKLVSPHDENIKMYGYGRIGKLSGSDGASHIAAFDLCEKIKRKLRLSHLLTVGDLKKKVQYACVCAGSGGGLLDDVISSGGDFYLTGELHHHDALKAERHGLVVVCTHHSHTERLALPWLAKKIRSLLSDLEVWVSEKDVDPFHWI